MSVYGNPAGLAAIEGLQLRASYFWDNISGHLPTGEPSPPSRRSVNERLHGPSFLAAVPNQYFPGTLGLGFNNYWFDVSNDPSGTSGHGQTYLASYGYPLFENLYLGYGFGVLGQEQDRRTNVGFKQVGGSNDGRLYSHRFGVMYIPVECVTLGAMFTYGHGRTSRSLHDGGPGFSADHDFYEGRIGASWQVLEKTMLAADLKVSRADIDSHRYIPNAINVGEQGDVFGIGFGVEQGITDWLSLRGGYRFHIDEYDFNSAPASDDRITYQALSCGAGLKWRGLSLDYGIEYRHIGDGDWMNVLSTGWAF